MKTFIALFLGVQLAVNLSDASQVAKKVPFNHRYRFRKASHEFNDHNSISIFCPSNTTGKPSDSTHYGVKEAPFTVEEPVLKSTESLYENLCVCPKNTTTYFNIDNVAGKTKQHHGYFNRTTLKEYTGYTFIVNDTLMFICETGMFMCPCFEELECSCLDNTGIHTIVHVIRFVTFLLLSHVLYLVTLMMREQEEQEKSKIKYRLLLRMGGVFFLYGCAVILIIFLTYYYDRQIRAGICGGHAKLCL